MAQSSTDPSPLATAADALIAVYQFLTRGQPRRCRFYPTCSQYSRQAFTAHGFLWGGWKTVLRLLKCHPWHPGGVDFVSKEETVCNNAIS